MAEFGTLLALFLIILIGFYLLGTPIAFSLGLTSLTIMLLPVGPSFTYQVFASQMYSQLNSFTLLAIPFFLFAGRMMNVIGMTDDLFDFATELVGSFPGGLGHVNVVVSILFSGMSGSAVADAAGVGVVEYKAMVERGYSGRFAAGITGASATIGPIIPPSIPLIIYGVFAEESIGALFIAGIIPGLLMGVCLMIFITLLALRAGEKLSQTRFPNLKRLGITGLKAVPGFLAPVIIIGGILFGFFTPTEAAAVAGLYTVIIGFGHYGLKLENILQTSKKTFEDTAVLTIIIGFASVYAFLINISGLPSMIEAFVLDFPFGATLLLFIIVALLLILGTFMSLLAIIIVTVPLLAPILPALGINVIHFGIVMMIALMIGLITPPLGIILFVLERVTPLSLVEISKGVAIFYIPLLTALIILILFPELSLYLPRRFGLGGL
ncbi:TRAP transporter large permease [Natronorarus salvus]|uniref:TRAP transporter large permease n=1 Tax=Natronorarus salvus TaxID=3117733 RepID=UPI002F2674CA